MKRLGVLVAGLGIGLVVFALWMTRSWPFDGLPTPEPVSWSEASVDADAITVSGTGHYTLRASVTRGERLGREAQELWLFPLMEKGDVNAKQVRIMVAMEKEPGRTVTYEDLTLSGWARPPGVAMNRQLEDSFMGAGYFFAEDYFVLEVFPEVASSEVGQ
jgi:hypothetical protein